MKNKQFKALLIIGFLTTGMFIISCDKSEKNSIVLPPCQTINFGVLKMEFANANKPHRTIVTIGSQTIEKISEAGISVDNLQLNPGTYSVLINPINSQIAQIEYMTDTITITQCVKSIVIAPF